MKSAPQLDITIKTINECEYWIFRKKTTEKYKYKKNLLLKKEWMK